MSAPKFTHDAQKKTMGIYIHLKIAPERIDPQDWKNVYRETLQILEQYHFLDIVKGPLGLRCVERSGHRDNIFGSGSGGWRSQGDMLGGDNTEDFILYEDIAKYLEGLEPDDGHDILLELVPEEQEKYANCTSFVWSAKTQGKDSHIPLLAVACLICARFPDAAIVDGDISEAQCRRAADWANEFLDTPIDVPLTADMTRLLPRLMACVPEDRVLPAFFGMTLEGSYAKTGQYLEATLPERLIEDYFRDAVKRADCDEGESNLLLRQVQKYLSLGLDMTRLCRIVMTDEDGNILAPRDFLRELLKMKLHVPLDEKETNDYTQTARDKNLAVPDDVDLQFSRMFARMIGGMNTNVAAHIPLDKICALFGAVLGDGVDYMQVAEELLSKLEGEKDAMQQMFYDDPDSDYQKRVAEREVELLELEKYDIQSKDELIYYEAGNTLAPEVLEQVETDFASIRQFAEAHWEEFSALDRAQREELLREHYQIMLTREKLEEICQNLMNDEYMRKYLGLFLVDCSKGGAWERIRAYFRNDELFEAFAGQASKGE